MFVMIYLGLWCFWETQPGAIVDLFIEILVISFITSNLNVGVLLSC